MEEIRIRWRSSVENKAVNILHAEAFMHELLEDDWANQLDQHSLGWVTAYLGDDLVGFLNVPWDGRFHAWLQDVMVATTARHRGIGKQMVASAVQQARDAGCKWLHVDFDTHLERFYLETCGFERTAAGLIKL